MPHFRPEPSSPALCHSWTGNHGQIKSVGPYIIADHSLHWLDMSLVLHDHALLSQSTFPLLPLFSRSLRTITAAKSCIAQCRPLFSLFWSLILWSLPPSYYQLLSTRGLAIPCQSVFSRAPNEKRP